jgi:hypothetical protein
MIMTMRKRLEIRLFRGGRRWRRELARCEWVGTAEATAVLGFTARHLYRLVGSELHPRRRGGRWYFQVKELLLAQRRRTRGLQ